MTTTGTCKYCGQVKTIDRVPEGYDPCEDCMAYEDDGVEACENCLWRDSEYITRLGKGGKRGDYETY